MAYLVQIWSSDPSLICKINHNQRRLILLSGAFGRHTLSTSVIDRHSSLSTSDTGHGCSQARLSPLLLESTRKSRDGSPVHCLRAIARLIEAWRQCCLARAIASRTSGSAEGGSPSADVWLHSCSYSPAITSGFRATCQSMGVALSWRVHLFGLARAFSPGWLGS